MNPHFVAVESLFVRAPSASDALLLADLGSNPGLSLLAGCTVAVLGSVVVSLIAAR